MCRISALCRPIPPHGSVMRHGPGIVIDAGPISIPCHFCSRWLPVIIAASRPTISSRTCLEFICSVLRTSYIIVHTHIYARDNFQRFLRATTNRRSFTRRGFLNRPIDSFRPFFALFSSLRLRSLESRRISIFVRLVNFIIFFFLYRTRRLCGIVDDTSINKLINIYLLIFERNWECFT